jgi:hypothetical protein
MVPTTALKVLFGLLPHHLVEGAEPRSSACRLSGKDMWLGRGLGTGHAWILAQLMKSDPVFQMGKKKMI